MLDLLYLKFLEGKFVLQSKSMIWISKKIDIWRKSYVLRACGSKLNACKEKEKEIRGVKWLWFDGGHVVKLSKSSRLKENLYWRFSYEEKGETFFNEN